MRYFLMMILAMGGVAGATGIDGYHAKDMDWKKLRPGVYARDSWRQSAISSYRYHLQVRCLCPLDGGSTVYVVEDRVVKVENNQGETRQLPVDLMQSLTIPGLYALIDRYAAQQPDRMAWKLNRHLGYPEVIEIDPSYRVADDEIYYVLSDFKVLIKTGS